MQPFPVDPEERVRLIAKRAYELYESRGSGDGSDLADCGDKVRVIHSDRGSAGSPNCIEDQKVSDSFRNTQSGRDGRRILKFVRESFTALKRPNDGRTARGLHGHHPRPLRPDPANCSISSNAFHIPINPVPPPVG